MIGFDISYDCIRRAGMVVFDISYGCIPRAGMVENHP